MSKNSLPLITYKNSYSDYQEANNLSIYYTLIRRFIRILDESKEGKSLPMSLKNI